MKKLLLILILSISVTSACVFNTDKPPMVDIGEYDYYSLLVNIKVISNNDMSYTVEEQVEALEDIRDNQAQFLATNIFQDATQVKFKEEHVGDYWGNYEGAGWGQIIWPDGSLEGFDANRMIRHGGFGIYQNFTPVTTRSHGRRMFWMADAEERKDVKKVIIFEDGWHPVVEQSVLATQESLGITSLLVACEVKIELRKAQ